MRPPKNAGKAPAGAPLQVVPAEVEVPDSREGEERGAYPTDEGCPCVVPAVVELGPGRRVPEAEREHMAGPIAAPDASPPAAVFSTSITSPPRVEVAPGVAGDAVLEGQKRVPLLRHAVRASRPAERQGVHGCGQGQGGDDAAEDQELGCGDGMLGHGD